VLGAVQVAADVIQEEAVADGLGRGHVGAALGAAEDEGGAAAWREGEGVPRGGVGDDGKGLREGFVGGG
jgi:hypothetical protein